MRAPGGWWNRQVSTGVLGVGSRRTAGPTVGGKVPCRGDVEARRGDGARSPRSSGRPGADGQAPGLEVGPRGGRRWSGRSMGVNAGAGRGGRRRGLAPSRGFRSRGRCRTRATGARVGGRHVPARVAGALSCRRAGADNGARWCAATGVVRPGSRSHRRGRPVLVGRRRRLPVGGRVVRRVVVVMPPSQPSGRSPGSVAAS